MLLDALRGKSTFLSQPNNNQGLCKRRNVIYEAFCLSCQNKIEKEKMTRELETVTSEQKNDARKDYETSVVKKNDSKNKRKFDEKQKKIM